MATGLTFISSDPNYPENLSVAGQRTRYGITPVPQLASMVIERRVYFAANVTSDSFEIKEYANSFTYA